MAQTVPERGGRGYWILETGRNENRRSIPLGYVTEPRADLALANLQREEDESTVARIWWIQESDPARAVAALLGDEALAPPQQPCLPLRRVCCHG
jgi:hypothetical protein